MHWNHRIIKHEDPDGDWFAIHEVFYADDGTPDNCTAEPIKIIQEDVKAIEWEIKKLEKAIKKPVIDYSYFEELEKKAEDEG